MRRLVHHEYIRLKRRASYQLRKVILRGDIPHPYTLLCVDCRRPARGYDHRDYTKPLDVVPVCTRCNVLRGPGGPVKLYLKYYRHRGKRGQTKFVKLFMEQGHR